MVVELQADEGRRGGSPRLGLAPVARESSVRQIGRKVASADPAENSNMVERCKREPVSLVRNQSLHFRMMDQAWQGMPPGACMLEGRVAIRS